MGKKIFLSEAQFKEYVRQQLNEGASNNGGIKELCDYYAESLKDIAEKVAMLGQLYESLGVMIKDELAKEGFVVGDVQEIERYGSPGITVRVDASKVYIHPDYESEPDDYLYELAEDAVYNLLKGKGYVFTFGAYFDSADVSYENGVITIIPRVKDWIDLDKIYDFISSY